MPNVVQDDSRPGEPAGSAGRRLSYLCFQVTRQGQASHAHVTEIIRGLERRGWQVSLFEPDYGTGSQAPSLWRRIISYWPVQMRLWRTSPVPEVLYVRAHPAALPSLMWARLKGIAVIQEVNGTFDDLRLIYPRLWPLSPFIRGICRLCLRMADGVITVTSELRQWLQPMARGASITVVPNGANTELFHPGEPARELAGQRYVVFVGAMSPWQGLETMLAAVSLPEWPRSVRLVLVGDGVERPKAEAAAALNGAVVCLGGRNYREIPGILRGAIAGLSVQNTRRQSQRFGFSALKVFETLACGVPVIVTDFPGQREVVIDNDCGIVIPPDNPRALASAVARLTANLGAAAEMGRRGSHAVVREHSWQRRADDTIDAIESTIAERARHV
ncbi:MAG TPA: glycosyltransferase family 4 protein [Bryobacteraceae bacterium]|nr:glycosyltransferase family 4 protein [Bryobacteraceae bacterium]